MQLLNKASIFAWIFVSHVFLLHTGFSQTWQAGTSDWNTAGNWTTGIPDSNTETATFSTTGSTTVNLSSNTTVQAVVFGAGSQGYTIGSSSGSTLSIDINSAATGYIFTLSTTSAPVIVNANIQISDSNGATNVAGLGMNNGSSLTINGNITAISSQSIATGFGNGTVYINGAVDLKGGSYQNGGTNTTYFNPTSTTSNNSIRGLSNVGIIYLMKDFTTGSISVGTTTGVSNGKMYLGSAGMSMSRGFTFFGGTGASGTMTFGADMTSGGTATQAGTLTVTTAAAGFTNTNNLDATDANDVLDIAGVISGSVTAGEVVLTKTGLGTVKFSGTSSNTFSSAGGTARVAVAAGTLELNKTAGVTAIGNMAISVANGATLKWNDSNQVGDTAAITLDGGTINFDGNSETMGTLALTANSSLDMGSGTSNIVFEDSSATWTASNLTVSNYSVGLDTLRFGTTAGGATGSRIIYTDLGGIAGTISATGFVTPDSTSITITGNDALVTANIAGTNVVNQTGSGTMTLTGTNTSSGTATVSNGTMVIGTDAGGNWAGNVIVTDVGILKGRGTISGSLTLNSGFYSAGNSPGIQNVGTFVVNAGGTHLVEIDGASAGNGSGFHDQTISAGAVTLNGGRLQGFTNFTGSTGFRPALGSKINFLQGSSITGSYSRYDYSSNTSGISFITEYRNTEVNLFTVPADWGSDIAGMSNNQRSLGRGLQSFAPQSIDNRVGLSDREKIFNGLMRQDNGGLKTAYDQLSPEKLVAMSSSVSTLSSIANGGTSQRLSQIRRGDKGVSLNGLSFKTLDGDEEYEKLALDQGVLLVKKKKETLKNGFFINTTGSYAKVETATNRQGFENRLGGITAGIDREFTEKIAGGVFASQGYADTLLSGGGSLESNSGRIGVYGGYHHRGFYFNSSLSGGVTSFDSKRKLSFIGETAEGSTQGVDVAGQVVTGLEIQAGNWVWGPTAKFDYGYQAIDRFREHGSAARLHVFDQNQTQIETAVGFRVSRPFNYKGWRWVPHVQLLGSYQWYEPGKIQARFDAGGNAFTVRPEGAGQTMLIPGVGCTVYLNERNSLNLNYEARVNSYSLSHQLDFGWQMRF